MRIETTEGKNMQRKIYPSKIKSPSADYKINHRYL
jgi:hypothetical protein